MKFRVLVVIGVILVILTSSLGVMAHGTDPVGEVNFPRTQESYEDGHLTSIWEIIKGRIEADPFNLVATLIFFAAIAHTMLTNTFNKKAHQLEARVEALKEAGQIDKDYQSIWAGILHLFGEIEAVFGIWAIALALAIMSFYDWTTFVTYVNGLHYNEPLFIIVVMTIASSRPILKFFELLMEKIVKQFGNSLEAWWLCLLIIAPLLGSFVTGPAAMTITAFLLSDRFYVLNPNNRLKYATLALLFINISVGGALTNFASPPILMVAGPWDWSLGFMFFTFGWKAILSIVITTFAYYYYFKKDLSELHEAYDNFNYKRYIQHRFISKKELEENFEDLESLVDKRVGFTSELNAYSIILRENIKELASLKLTKEELELYDINNAIDEKFDGIKLEEMKRTVPGLLSKDVRPTYMDPLWDQREERVPPWIMIVHIAFLIWTVVNAHEPVLVLSGFLFFLGFFQVTVFYQNRMDLKPALLVAFFLAGLMVHGTLQAWWIAPLLGNLPEVGLNLTSIVLTAFNDNAAITYLSTLVPNFSDSLKYAIVAGAITGGGLTIIANSPNPIGQSILKKHFGNSISSVLLLKFAVIPTAFTALVFILLA